MRCRSAKTLNSLKSAERHNGNLQFTKYTSNFQTFHFPLVLIFEQRRW